MCGCGRTSTVRGLTSLFLGLFLGLIGIDSQTGQARFAFGVPELLDGVRQYALKEFGPMVMTVFDSWGIRSCEDIGHMVFNLIGAGVFGKTEDDSIKDFRNVYDFAEAFLRPFAPVKPESAKPTTQVPSPRPATSSK